MSIFLEILAKRFGFDLGDKSSASKPKKVKTSKPMFALHWRILLSLFSTAALGFAAFYITLPPLSIHAFSFYVFALFLCVVFSLFMHWLGNYSVVSSNPVKTYFKSQPVPAVIICLVVLVVVVGFISGVKLLRADDYAALLEVQDGDFTADVEEIDWNQIPMLDSTSANNLANRKLGELSDLVSQFVVSDRSVQINYKGNPVRVTYLDYASFFKWYNNNDKGIPAYMTIDMRTQQVEVVRLEKGMKYSPSEYFGRNLQRYLRFEYPTLIFDDITFEIDEEGTPYWIASVVKKRIGLFGGNDIAGAVLLNAVTGESEYLPTKDIYPWVDRVYPSDMLIQQYDYRGIYTNGFWNSMFEQTGCTATTDGYNYIALDDDVWMYTGITSVTSDEGNIGFILVNQRTKEAKYYICAGAEEYSAMSSAEGAVQQYGYNSTFPLLLNISDQPTYFMSLKDGAGLVKMYAMVNVKQYQIVATGYSLEECQNNYHALLVSNKLIDEDNVTNEKPNVNNDTGLIEEIRSANIDGNTLFYLRLQGKEFYYTVSAKDYPIAAVLDVGDKITVEYIPTNDLLIPITKLITDQG